MESKKGSGRKFQSICNRQMPRLPTDTPFSPPNGPNSQKQRRGNCLGERDPVTLRGLVGEVRFPRIIPRTGPPILQIARFLQFVIRSIRTGRRRKYEFSSGDLRQRVRSECICRPSPGGISRVGHSIVRAGRAARGTARSPLCGQIWIATPPGETESSAIRSRRPGCQIAERHLLQDLPGGSLQRQRLPLIA